MFEEDVPDATTFEVFRNAIQPKWYSLLEILNRQIESAGFEIKKAIKVDATLICAHSKQCICLFSKIAGRVSSGYAVQSIGQIHKYFSNNKNFNSKGAQSFLSLKQPAV